MYAFSFENQLPWENFQFHFIIIWNIFCNNATFTFLLIVNNAHLQKFLLLIWSTSEWWKAESTLKPTSGFEHETLGLGIQRIDHSLSSLYAFSMWNEFDLWWI